MPRTNKLSPYATTIVGTPEGETIVTYHATPIVRFTAGEVTLNTGGWDTVTTRRKMNQASRQFGLGYGVYRRNGITFLDMPDGSSRVMPSLIRFVRRAEA